MKKVAAIFVLASVMLSFSYKTSDEVVVEFLLEYLNVKYEGESLNDFIYVGVKRQKLYYIKDQKLVKSYKVSTSKRGAGNEAGTNKTPIGLHLIEQKIGNEAPEGAIFKNRKPTGKIAKINLTKKSSGKDEITTRIMTLQGLEPGINQGVNEIDTYQRRVYIHGTPEEGLIGQPASHGCVRMKNKDVIELFDVVSEGIKVIILNN